MSCSIITPDSYNALPVFSPDMTINEEHLLALGKLILEHGALATIGVQLLHRHFSLQPGQIMHAIATHGATVSQPTMISSLADRPVRGSAFFLDPSGTFQPFEYTSGDQIPIDAALSNKIADYLKAHHLEQSLGLAVRHDSTDKGPFLEMLIAEDDTGAPYGTITRPVSADITLSDDALPTGWTFQATPEGVALADGKTYCQAVHGSKDERHRVFTGKLNEL